MRYFRYPYYKPIRTMLDNPVFFNHIRIWKYINVVFHIHVWYSLIYMIKIVSKHVFSVTRWDSLFLRMTRNPVGLRNEMSSGPPAIAKSVMTITICGYFLGSFALRCLQHNIAALILAFKHMAVVVVCNVVFHRLQLWHFLCSRLHANASLK